MKAFKKVVRPCSVMEWSRVGHETPAKVFCTIELREGGELSITGVVGPTSNGDARGSCGQINETLQKAVDAGKVESYADGWDQDKLAQLLGIWDRWHLNHMSAADHAMRRDGWLAQREEAVWVHKYTLSREAMKQKTDAEDAAKKALKKGETFGYTPEQLEAVNRPYSTQRITETATPPATPDHYSPADRYLPGGGKVAEGPERKTMGWLRPDEHPRGLLGKKHPETGNGYGSAWYREDVPEDVLQWLADLPAADVRHPWGS